MIGTVLANNGGSWGFIAPANPMLENVFWHRANLLDGRQRLIAGEVVEYEIGVSNRTGKPTAINIRVIKAAPVACIAPQGVL